MMAAMRGRPVSHVLRRNSAVLARLGEAATGGDDLYMCPVVLYELRRGLTYRDARRQLENLDGFTRTLQGVSVQEPVLGVGVADSRCWRP